MQIPKTVTGKRFKTALAGGALAVFLGVAGLVTVGAQGAPGQISPNPLDAILAKLDQVLPALNATPATNVVLSTPIFGAGTQGPPSGVNSASQVHPPRPFGRI